MNIILKPIPPATPLGRPLKLTINKHANIILSHKIICKVSFHFFLFYVVVSFIIKNGDTLNKFLKSLFDKTFIHLVIVNCRQKCDVGIKYLRTDVRWVFWCCRIFRLNFSFSQRRQWLHWSVGMLGLLLLTVTKPRFSWILSLFHDLFFFVLLPRCLKHFFICLVLYSKPTWKMFKFY